MARHMENPLAYPAAKACHSFHPSKMLAVVGMLAIFAVQNPAIAQDRNQSNELYHIFDLKTAAPKRDMIAAAGTGLKRNTSDAQTMTPIVIRLAALLTWSPKALSEVTSIWPRNRPRRALCTSRRRSRGRSVSRSSAPDNDC